MALVSGRPFAVVLPNTFGSLGCRFPLVDAAHCPASFQSTGEGTTRMFFVFGLPPQKGQVEVGVGGAAQPVGQQLGAVGSPTSQGNHAIFVS